MNLKEILNLILTQSTALWKRLGKWRWAVVVVILFFVFKSFSGCFAPKGDYQILRSAKVKRGDLVVKITATGEVKPQNRVEIKPPIAGRIEQVLVEEGDQVKQGQVLAWMSSTDRAALLDSARSQGPEEYKKWENAYKPAPLVAPLDGSVIVRDVQPGQTVTTSDPVVVLSDRLIVKAQVDETDLSYIKLGQDVEISLDAYPGQIIRAKVDHISFESTLVNNVNVYEVDILPEKIPEHFRSGMTADVTFIVSDRHNVLLVPSEAVVGMPVGRNPQAGSASLAVYEKSFGGKLKAVPVEVGESDGRMTEITNGLKEGQTVQIVRRNQADMGTNPFSAFGGRRKEKGSSRS